MNNKNFYIESNKELINEAKNIINKKVNFHDLCKMDYYYELEEIRDKLFEYKNETFKKADEYLLNDNQMLNKQATIYLDVEIEEIIEEILKRECDLYNEHNNVLIKKPLSKKRISY